MKEARLFVCLFVCSLIFSSIVSMKFHSLFLVFFLFLSFSSFFSCQTLSFNATDEGGIEPLGVVGNPAYANSHFGVDISDYQTSVDAVTAIASLRSFGNGAQPFMIRKVSEGLYTNQKNAKRDLANFRRGGAVTGVYHFAHPKMDAEQQINHFRAAATSAGYTGSLYILDMEVTNNLPWSDVVEATNKMLQLLGDQGVLYTSYSWHTQFKQADPDYPWGFPVWLARYGPSSLGARGVALWQFTDSQKVNGIGGNVDADVFLGDENLWGSLMAPNSELISE
jgi:lysozyme